MPIKRTGTEIKIDDYNYDENDNTINQQPQQTPAGENTPALTHGDAAAGYRRPPGWPHRSRG